MDPPLWNVEPPTRWNITPAQRRLLERTYKTTPYPVFALREQLGRQLNVTPRQVQIWFQNRRQRSRKGVREEEDDVDEEEDLRALEEEAAQQAAIQAAKRQPTTYTPQGQGMPVVAHLSHPSCFDPCAAHAGGGTMAADLAAMGYGPPYLQAGGAQGLMPPPPGQPQTGMGLPGMQGLPSLPPPGGLQQQGMMQGAGPLLPTPPVTAQPPMQGGLPMPPPSLPSVPTSEPAEHGDFRPPLY